MHNSFLTSAMLNVLFFSAIIMYFLPTIVAMLRDHRQKLQVFILNLLAGWTFVGWIVAIVWACEKKPVQKQAGMLLEIEE
ncbi:MAG: superinfection immunity protein [Chlorobiaceae bacterium]|jgi:hypothetical protein|nr:superinfection immunity protein [Chlorobiaceae bacterium]